MSLFLGWLLSLFQTQIKIEKCIPNPERRTKTTQLTYIHPKNVGMIYIIIKKNPQSVGWIYPYFYKCIFPNPTPERSNNHSKWWLSNTNINIQLTYIYSQNCLQHISPKLLAAYIQYKFIFQQIYIPQQCTRRTHRNSNNTSSPQVLAWYIQYPHICIQLTFIPQIVGCIYPIRYLYF